MKSSNSFAIEAFDVHKNNVTVLVVGLTLFLFAIPLWGQFETESFQGRQVVAHEVLVKFRTTAFTAQTLGQIKFVDDIDLAEGIGAGDVLRFHSRSKDVATLVNELSARSDVVYAEPNFIEQAIAVPNDPRFGELWGLHNTGQVPLGGLDAGIAGTPGADIQATLAWGISTGSRATVIAVVDTGVDYTHPDLAANIWSAPKAFTVNIGGSPITCPAGSHGFNAITNACDPMDDNHHGTHVSGTIGAIGNNSVGVVGVNWKTSIIGAKFLNSLGFGTTAGAINAIEFVIQAKGILGAGANVRVLSNSWGGGGFSQSLLDEINKANANEMLFVAAAGNNASNNDTNPVYPADYNTPNMIAVAATDNKDGLASFSDYGAQTVHLGAPGVSILSTTPGGNYGYLDGTSMATPHVSGAAALVLSRCTYNTASLKQDLLTSVDPIPSLAGRTITGGRLNVNKAISACLPDFSLTLTPVWLSKFVISYFKVTVRPAGGFTGTVALTCSDPGFICKLSPTSITLGSFGASVMTGPRSAFDWDGTTVTGTSGGLTHSADFLYDGAPPPPCKPILCQ